MPRKALSKFTWALPLASGLSGVFIGCSPGAESVEMALSLTPSENISTVIFADWEPPEAGVGFVEFGLDGAFDQASPPVETASDLHEATLLGLKAGFTYDFRAVLETEDGERVESAIQTLTLDPPPAELDRFTMTVPKSDGQEGYILTSLLQPLGSWAVILDRDGDYVWYWPSSDGLAISNVKPNPDGTSILLNQGDGAQLNDYGGSLSVSLDGETTVYTRTPMSHHDSVQLPDDTIAYIAMDIRLGTMERTIAEPASKTLETLETRIAGDAILEVPVGTTTDRASVLLEELGAPYNQKFNFFDDYRDPWVYCDHSVAEAYSTGALDWTHANSLMFDADENAYFLMSKVLDGLWKIDRATGEVLWQMGGEFSDFTAEPTDWWSHAHMSHIWDGGMVLFDNGYHHSDRTSGIAEYAWNEETHTVERVFEYRDPRGHFVAMLGDARKLPSGNYLTSWATLGLLKEIDPQGEVVWEASSAIGNATTRARYLTNLYDLTQ